MPHAHADCETQDRVLADEPLLRASRAAATPSPAARDSRCGWRRAEVPHHLLEAQLVLAHTPHAAVTVAPGRCGSRLRAQPTHGL